MDIGYTTSAVRAVKTQTASWDNMVFETSISMVRKIAILILLPIHRYHHNIYNFFNYYSYFNKKYFQVA